MRVGVPAEMRAGRLVEARPESRKGPSGCGTWTFRTGRGARKPRAAGPGRGTKRPERLEPKQIEGGTPTRRTTNPIYAGFCLTADG